MENKKENTIVTFSMDPEAAKKIIWLWETNEKFRQEMLNLGVIVIQEHKNEDES